MKNVRKLNLTIWSLSDKYASKGYRQNKQKNKILLLEKQAFNTRFW